MPIQVGLNQWCDSCEFGVEYPAYGDTLPTVGDLLKEKERKQKENKGESVAPQTSKGE